MPYSDLLIQCANIRCDASNKYNQSICQKCNTPITKNYLWATPIFSESASENDKLQSTQDLDEEKVDSDRYKNINSRIYLDTQPGKSSARHEQLPSQIIKQLKLFPFFPHIPKIHGQLESSDFWLLDYGTVPLDLDSKLIFPDLLPTIDSLWVKANSSQQLYWLRQIVGLWNPLSMQKMSKTLLNPDLIRINGSLVQLIELITDEESNPPELSDLGKTWTSWAEKANVEIQDVLVNLCQRIQVGSINQVQEILSVLDRTLELCTQSQEYSHEIFTLSDPGPSRKNNQDKAYPESDTPIKKIDSQNSLIIVCDGVGGHEGGEIASQETVKALSKSVTKLTWNQPSESPSQVFAAITKLVGKANEIIAGRNDKEQRQEKQRMGTTMVMTLAHNHEMYISHVGDSRIYLITKNSCHQITIDDDLASREVRLGYAIYKDALKSPSSGALVQAIGMNSSLNPNMRRLVIDKDCVFLLCTDGLSDFDRVEQYWRYYIAPILEDKLDLKKAVESLVKIANIANGHDNVTVGLVHCKIQPKEGLEKPVITWSDVEVSLADAILWTDENLGNVYLPDTEFEFLKTDQKYENNRLGANQKSKKSLINTLIIVIISVLLTCLGFLLFSNYQNRQLLQENPEQNTSIPDSEE